MSLTVKQRQLLSIALALFVSHGARGVAWAELQPPADPVAVVEGFTRALNDHDVDAVLSYLDDDATVRGDDAPQVSGQIRDWVLQLVNEDVRVVLEGAPSLAPDASSTRPRSVVNWAATISLRRYRALGYESVKGTVGAIVHGNRMTFVRIWANPEWQAR